jgi:hypothetical protein
VFSLQRTWPFGARLRWLNHLTRGWSHRNRRPDFVGGAVSMRLARVAVLILCRPREYLNTNVYQLRSPIQASNEFSPPVGTPFPPLSLSPHTRYREVACKFAANKIPSTDSPWPFSGSSRRVRAHSYCRVCEHSGAKSAICVCPHRQIKSPLKKSTNKPTVLYVSNTFRFTHTHKPSHP